MTRWTVLIGLGRYGQICEAQKEMAGGEIMQEQIQRVQILYHHVGFFASDRAAAMRLRLCALSCGVAYLPDRLSGLIRSLYRWAGPIPSPTTDITHHQLQLI